MITAIATLSLIGTLLGLLLSTVNRLLPFQEDPLIEEVVELLPGTQCGQCGFAGCRQAAEAVIDHQAPLTLCPPGGPALARQLAEALGRELNQATTESHRPSIARVDKSLCIGCTRCLRECPTDALVGAAKQLHVVLDHACTGCGACVSVCPTAGIEMREIPLTLSNWRWSRPAPTIIARA